MRSGYHNDIFNSHPSYDACTNLLVTPPKDKTLCTNRAENNFCLMALVEQRPECFFIDILGYCFPVFYSINAEQGFGSAKFAGNRSRSCPCAEDIEHIRDHNFTDKSGDFTLWHAPRHFLQTPAWRSGSFLQLTVHGLCHTGEFSVPRPGMPPHPHPSLLNPGTIVHLVS